MVRISVANLWKRFRVYKRPRYWLYEKMSFKRKIYVEDIVALRDISFHLEAGNCLGVIGSNGAGKSTLLKILAGISHPSEGDVEINGRVSALIELGSGFHPEFSGRENLILNGMLWGFSKREFQRKLEEIIEFAELGEFIDLPLRTYSTGMCLRLGFALASSVEPDILLVDEALSVGDEYFRAKCIARMREFLKEERIMIVVSHDLTMIRGLCNCAIYLKDGEIRKRGSPNEVIETYLDEIYEKKILEQGTMVSSSGWKRRGTGSAKIERVSIKDAGGRERTIFRQGEEICIEFEYSSYADIKKPLFGINLFRSDGVLVLSSNQECAGLVKKEIEGTEVIDGVGDLLKAGHRGKVEYRFRNFFVPGTYQVSVNIFQGPSGFGFALDEVFDVARIEIQEGKFLDRGIVIVPCRWRIS